MLDIERILRQKNEDNSLVMLTEVFQLHAADTIAKLEIENTELKSLVKKLYYAKGRYHTQLAACDLFDACGYKSYKPTK